MVIPAKLPVFPTKPVVTPELLVPKVAEVRPLRAFKLNKFMGLVFPKRSPLMGAWLRKQSLCMVYGPRGVGKTHVFLAWRAQRSAKIVYLDGEMAGEQIQGRMKVILDRYELDVQEAHPFHLITPDVQEGLLPDLATAEGQAFIDDAIPSDTELIVVDNLSSWCRSGREDAESWNIISAWALRKRAEGKAVLFVHHSGKNGGQRGTSRREDHLDAVLELRLPKDYHPKQGARFEIHFRKSRDLHGKSVLPILARLKSKTGKLPKWIWSRLDGLDQRAAAMVKLANEGVIAAEIAKQLKVSPATVSRTLADARKKGLIKAEEKK
jgi:DNA-binding transcriptional ArsR family regulator